jgi:hypothetical protein
MKIRRTLRTLMRTSSDVRSKEGKIGWALLWLMGVPIPILFIFFLMRGCT